jgi:hypothetical protein
MSRTHYHEAGHSVFDYILGFRPKWIRGAVAMHDRRGTAFLRARNGLLCSSHAHERAQDFAVTIIAGITAEAKYANISISELRETAGKDDYEKVRALAERLVLLKGFERPDDLISAYIELWEACAAAMMTDSRVWSAVESIVACLENAEGNLERVELREAIEYGLKGGARNQQAL